MKILSIRQPWAFLITSGVKDIENRSWPTRHRGPIVIHASLAMATTPLDQIEREFGISIDRRSLLRGGIVGMVDIIDCVREHPSKWFDGEGYGFVLRNARALPFEPMQGALRFFNRRAA